MKEKITEKIRLILSVIIKKVKSIYGIIIKKIMLIISAIIIVGASFVSLYWLAREASYLCEWQEFVVRTLGPFYNSFMFICYCLVAFGIVIVYFAIFDKGVNLEEESEEK